ncbi:MAG: polC [Pseudonocardiales bacterium]|nr:polC [Pseudonocardiales bacterium]
MQLTFDDLDEPLRAVTFVVVDLETTGGVPGTDAITEIGAVKVRGGEVLGEFQTLVDPGRGIPPFISILTGITDSMVIQAPRIEEVLPAFLEFASGSVLVAHNAKFDTGFLASACADAGRHWPWAARASVVDTVTLARRALARDEVPNCKLGTLARHFNASTEPIHRALADARATVDVLHALLDRVGGIGVHSLPELHAFTRAVSPAQRRKRRLAADLPSGPGVYIFRGPRDEALYIGTSKDVRTRVRRYFVASETRTRMGEMVGIADRVDAISCAHTLEAQVRELRLIAEHKPRFNRRSTRPERAQWLKLTREPYPRLSIVREARDDHERYLGPLRSRQLAEAVRDAIHEAVPLRQCGDRLSATVVTRPACALAEMARCGAPCEHRLAPDAYGLLSDAVAAAWSGDIRPLLDPLLARMRGLSDAGRYEHAGAMRDRAAALIAACARSQRIAALVGIDELVAAAPDGSGGWDLAVIHRGRLAAAGTAPRGIAPMPVVDSLVATADGVAHRPGPLGAALAEEIELIARWLERPGTRLVLATQPWASPAFGAGGAARIAEAGESARAALAPFAAGRSLQVIGDPALPERRRVLGTGPDAELPMARSSQRQWHGHTMAR